MVCKIPCAGPEIAEDLCEFVDHNVVGAQGCFLFIVDHVLLRPDRSCRDIRLNLSKRTSKLLTITTAQPRIHENEVNPPLPRDP